MITLFDRSSAQLVCSRCGHLFLNAGGSWEQMESYASIKANHSHKCGITARDRNLDNDVVKMMMKDLRKANPGMSFDEQQKVYSELIKKYGLQPLWT